MARRGPLKKNETKGLGGLRVEHSGYVPNSNYQAREPGGNKKTELPPPDEKLSSEIYTPTNNDAAIEAAHQQDLDKRNIRLK